MIPVLAFLLMCGMVVKAQIYDIEIDLKTSMLVLNQTIAQVAQEKANNLMVDSIKSAKARVAAKTASIALIKETHRASLANVSDFGPESRLYKNIGTKGVAILQKVPNTLDMILKANVVEKAVALHELGNVAAKATALVNTFVDLCGNARFASPMQTVKGEKPTMQGIMDGSGLTMRMGGTSTTVSGVDPQGGKRGDGHNLLKRSERYEMAYNIYQQLCSLNNELDQIGMLAQNARLGDMIYIYDRKSGNAFYGGKDAVESTIKMWNTKIK